MNKLRDKASPEADKHILVLGRCSYSSRGTDLVSSVSVPLGGALKK